MGLFILAYCIANHSSKSCLDLLCLKKIGLTASINILSDGNNKPGKRKFIKTLVGIDNDFIEIRFRIEVRAFAKQSKL